MGYNAQFEDAIIGIEANYTHFAGKVGKFERFVEPDRRQSATESLRRPVIRMSTTSP